MKYAVRPTTKFQKDLKRIQKRGYNIDLLTEVIKKFEFFYQMNKELEISERFDIDDIRKIRDYNAQHYAEMTPTEIVKITRAGAEEVLKHLMKIEA